MRQRKSKGKTDKNKINLTQPLPSHYSNLEDWAKANEEYKDQIEGKGHLQKLKNQCKQCPHRKGCPAVVNDFSYTTRSSLCYLMEKAIVTHNKYLRIYGDEDVPTFSFVALRRLANDKTLNEQERSAFQMAVKEAKDLAKEKRVSPSMMMAFVRPESGTLAVTLDPAKNKNIPFIGAGEVELHYDQSVSLAFGVQTQDDLAIHYQHILKEAKRTVEEWHLDLYRIIFLQDQNTGKVKIWVD